MNSTSKILLIACTLGLAACQPAAEPASNRASESAGTTPPVVESPEVVAAPEPAAAEPSDTAVTADTLTFEGLGDVRYGMGKDAFLALKNTKPGGSELMDGPDSCHFFLLKSPAETAVMLEKQRVVRIDAGPALKNAIGVNAGDDVATATAKYPKAEVAPHKYDFGGKEITLWNDARTAAFVIESNAQGRVTHVRSGIPPNVSYVEGCS